VVVDVHRHECGVICRICSYRPKFGQHSQSPRRGARRAAEDLVPCPRALQRGERDYIGGGNFPVGLGVFYDGAKQYVYKKLNNIAIAARIKETALRRIQLPLLLSERKPDFVPKTMPY
jgi:hypothetical protein